MATRKYKGSTCSADCGGHRAGARYYRGGGRTPSPYSPSFNKGMRIAQGGRARRLTRR
jgi:hypothetical protein